jgi:hypothetical protein
MVERSDQIIVKNIEIEEFSNLGPILEEVMDSITDYKRLGYRTIKIDKILGVPSGESAERALELMKELGFKVYETTKGNILISTDIDIDGFDEKEILPTMLLQQGLVPGEQLEHPLQIIEKLGSIVDRWEILSRIGSKRNRKFAEPDMYRIEALLDERFRSFIGSLNGSSEIFEIEWKDLLSKGMEDLSDLKDLSKRFSLYKGSLDQSSNVWSLKQEFQKYPRVVQNSQLNITEDGRNLLRKVKELNNEELNNHIKVHGLSSIVHDLVNKGLLIEDPWGSIIPLNRKWLERRKKKHLRGNIKGVLQRAWILRCAESLGAFRMEDLIEYSPELDDIAKMSIHAL